MNILYEMELQELIVLFGAMAVFLFVLLFRSHRQIYRLKLKYKDVIDIDKEVEIRKEKYRNLNKQISTLKGDYKEKRNIFEKLLKEISILEENLEYMDFGIYQPHFDFDTSEKYKIELQKIRNMQKEMIKDKDAIVCSTEWTVGGSKREGQKMTNRYMKLMLRAFNNECDSALLKIKWNNILKMEERIKKSFEVINKLGETQNINITGRYLDQSLKELHLAHEYQEKIYEEKEEQRRIREQMREEEKVKREIEKAMKDAENEEAQYQVALEKAKLELGKAYGEETKEFEEKIKVLQEQLEEAKRKKERALSRAQQTKNGHVYIISNIGSFGKNIYKIGMTRRLEPLERVKELGDASVPFAFDIHAMIFSKDAPSLENNLHRAFGQSRVNLVNERKEFFRVSLDDIAAKVKAMHGEIEFTKLVEAKEFRETVAIRNQARESVEVKKAVTEKFPDSI